MPSQHHQPTRIQPTTPFGPLPTPESPASSAIDTPTTNTPIDANTNNNSNGTITPVAAVEMSAGTRTSFVPCHWPAAAAPSPATINTSNSSYAGGERFGCSKDHSDSPFAFETERFGLLSSYTKQYYETTTTAVTAGVDLPTTSTHFPSTPATAVDVGSSPATPAATTATQTAATTKTTVGSSCVWETDNLFNEQTQETTTEENVSNVSLLLPFDTKADSVEDDDNSPLVAISVAPLSPSGGAASPIQPPTPPPTPSRSMFSYTQPQQQDHVVALTAAEELDGMATAEQTPPPLPASTVVSRIPRLLSRATTVPADTYIDVTTANEDDIVSGGVVDISKISRCAPAVVETTTMTPWDQPTFDCVSSSVDNFQQQQDCAAGITTTTTVTFSTTQTVQQIGCTGQYPTTPVVFKRHNNSRAGSPSRPRRGCTSPNPSAQRNLQQCRSPSPSRRHIACETPCLPSPPPVAKMTIPQSLFRPQSPFLRPPPTSAIISPHIIASAALSLQQHNNITRSSTPQLRSRPSRSTSRNSGGVLVNCQQQEQDGGANDHRPVVGTSRQRHQRTPTPSSRRPGSPLQRSRGEPSAIPQLEWRPRAAPRVGTNNNLSQSCEL
eukprot:GHVS01082519.1.p1 GENE.GHVS01082519.1~~GHVS01082519.1.p1  ORF type:complete len:678 (-),score=170.25 GHVS01082519.1:281-2110(-)